MKRLLCSYVVAFGALAGAAVTHPATAGALEPVWLTEEDLDRVTAGSALDLIETITIIDSTVTRTVETALPGGGTAVTSTTTISCDAKCDTSISIIQDVSSVVTSSTVSSSTVINSLPLSTVLVAPLP